MKLTGKKDLLIIGGALLLCAVAYLLFGALKGGDRVKIYVGDELYKEISLSEDQTVIIEQQDCKNVICIENGGVFMQGTVEEIFESAERLFDAGLDVPQITKQFIELKKRGVVSRSDVYTLGYAKKLIESGLGK